MGFPIKLKLQSITTRVAATMLLVSLLPMAGISIYNLVRSMAVLKRSELQNLEWMAISTARRLDDQIAHAQNTAQTVGNMPEVKNFLAASPAQRQTQLPALQELLLHIKQDDPEYDHISVLSSDGKFLISSAPELMGLSVASRSYFQAAIRGQNYISTLLLSITYRDPGIFFAVPVRQAGKRPLGVVVVKLKAKAVWAIVDQMQASSGDQAFVVDRDGLIISHSDRNLIYHSLIPLNPSLQRNIIANRKVGIKSIPSLNMPGLAAGTLQAQHPGHLSYTDEPNQEKRIIGFAPLSLQPWIVCISESERKFSTPLDELAWHNNYTLIIVATGTILLALILSGSIVQPVWVLTQAAQALEDNKFDPTVLAIAIQRRDDMGKLSRVFLKMAQEVQEREAKLQQQLINLQIEIDQEQRHQQVSEITETDYFQQLRQRSKELRRRSSVLNE